LVGFYPWNFFPEDCRYLYIVLLGAFTKLMGPRMGGREGEVRKFLKFFDQHLGG
jgi:hypothetical protein